MIKFKEPIPLGLINNRAYEIVGYQKSGGYYEAVITRFDSPDFIPVGFYHYLMMTNSDESDCQLTEPAIAFLSNPEKYIKENT